MMANQEDVLEKLQKEHDEVVAKRAQLEEELQGHQDHLRKVSREEQPDEHRARLAPVNEKKRQISELSFEHMELARMLARLKGAKNYMPPAG
jgi:predicted nuclease with TOPRIM domain